VKIDKEIQPKRVTVREIFFDFISFIAYSNGGIYSITEQDNKQETPQEKPQEKPQEEVENISFKSNNTALVSGSELEITAVELTGENKDRIEMETPVISVISSKKNSNNVL